MINANLSCRQAHTVVADQTSPCACCWSCGATVVRGRQEVRRDAGGWRQEFDAAARRSLKTRLRYAFVHTYKPVLDDARYRSFDTMAEYRAWCERELPSWLGYGQDL